MEKGGLGRPVAKGLVAKAATWPPPFAVTRVTLIVATPRGIARKRMLLEIGLLVVLISDASKETTAPSIVIVGSDMPLSFHEMGLCRPFYAQEVPGRRPGTRVVIPGIRDRPDATV